MPMRLCETLRFSSTFCFFIDSPFKVMIYYDDSEEEITACNYILDNSINDPKSDIDCQRKYKIYTRTGSTSMQCCC